MKITLKNNSKITINKLSKNDPDKLFNYLNDLSEDTKSKFGPHSFDIKTVKEICEEQDKKFLSFIAKNKEEKIVAYIVMKLGILEHDSERLESYGLKLDRKNDVTFAPSIIEEYQNLGLGSKMFLHVLKELKKRNSKKILLWGGVQKRNDLAIGFYKKAGFRKLGEFEWGGVNVDMVLEI